MLFRAAAGVAQTHKHSMALYCNSTAGGNIISNLIAFVRNYSSSSKASQTAAAKAAAAAGVAEQSPAGVPAQHAAMQGQLLQLLDTMNAAAARSRIASDARHNSTAAAADLGVGPAAPAAPNTQLDEGQQIEAVAAYGQGPTAAAAAAGGRAGSKRSRAAARLPAGRGSSMCDAQALQQLLQERQKDVMQLKQLSK
jgi:hypothetical protein